MRKSHKCEICGVTSDEKKVHWCTKAQKYLCLKHRSQFDRLGFFLKRTKREPNEFQMDGDTTYLIFRNTDDEVIFRCPIDTEDLDRVLLHKWHVTEMMGNSRYIKCSIGRRNVSLHRYILKAESDEIVDHINRNGLDNRKSNLRIVTASENSANSKTRSGTGEKNIYFHNNAYQVEIIRHYKSVYTASFHTLQEAVEARDEFIKKYNETHNRVV